jgi:hypothetical protein
MKAIKLVYALGVSALLAGCSNALDAPEFPVGTRGTVTLTVGQGVGARTVFPSLSQFSGVILKFAGTPAVADVEVPDSGSVTVTLTGAGAWTVAAEAYIGETTVAARSAPHSLAWTGTGDVTGDTRFVLVPTASGNGTLKYTVAPPDGSAGSMAIQELPGGTPFMQAVSGAISGEESLLPGRYSVDILLSNDDGAATAYHRTVAILSGLVTEIRFEPEPADFLSDETRAALTTVEGLVFGATEINVGQILVDDEDFVNGNISISAPNGTAAVYFTVAKPNDLILRPQGADAVSDAELSFSGPNLSVFKVDTGAAAGEAGGEFNLVIAAAQAGREEVPINVTVRVEPLTFGLFVKNGSELTRVNYPATNLNEAFAWLEANAVNNTDYVILLDGDAGMTHYSSKSGTSNVTVSLRGLFGERTVTYDGGTYTPASMDGLIDINAGTTFVADENITLDGPIYGSHSLVLVDGGAFIMKTGSKLVHCASLNGAVNSNSGGFIMEGGEICNNTSEGTFGAAVRVRAASSFTMLGGKIRDNLCRGAFISGEFAMAGGEISGNGLPTEAMPNGVPGAGVCVSGDSSASPSKFTMTGGKIINNGAPDMPGSGVFQQHAALTLDGPVAISGNSINVWCYSATVRGPITLGASFANEPGNPPIVVDTTTSTNSSNGALADIKNWWIGYACLVGTPAAIAEFAPGLVARASYSGVNQVFAVSSFTITASGRFNITE